MRTINALIFVGASLLCNEASAINLVPQIPSKAPDYLCTWNLQGYVTDYTGSERMRGAMIEKNMFGDGEFEGWVRLYPRIRQDIFFVMDDSWDIPAERNEKDGNPYLGLCDLDKTRFPSFSGLKQLSDSVVSYGWKGLGGWICAQQAEINPAVNDSVYWAEKLKISNDAGFKYWKVDWGKESKDYEWRKMISELAARNAPELVIEHAMIPKTIELSNVYRTYDIENIIARASTIRRVGELLFYTSKGEGKGIINCEDEPYIAAGLGCSIGIMRHPFAGNTPNGNIDTAFPEQCLDLKRRLNEVERGVIWHRIAAPIGVGGHFEIDSINLSEVWEFHNGDSYVRHRDGEEVKEYAPARISRNMPLPNVSDKGDFSPYVLASTYPEGAVAVATIGRSKGRENVLNPVDVSIEMKDCSKPLGIFGRYKTLTVIFPDGVKLKNRKVYAQDLLALEAVDITSKVKIKKNKLIIPGEIITTIGLGAADEGDLSEPGLVVHIQ